MAFDKAYKAPAVLTGTARGAFEGVYGASIVSDYLPLKGNTGLNFNFNVNETSLPRAARFRSFNTEADQTVFGGAESRQGKLPPISRRYNVDEYSHLKLVGGDLGAEFEAKAEAISAEIAVRLIEAAAEGIETGKVHIQERNLDFEIDFGRDSALSDNAGTVWSNTASTPIEDLEALRAVYGANPGAILIPSVVQQHLTKNEEIIKFVVGRGSDLPSRVSYADVLSVLASFGFTNLITNEERLIDHAGVERSLFSQNKVIFLPAGSDALSIATGNGPLGTTDVGITAEAMDPDNGVGGTPGVFAGAIRGHDPEGYDVLVSGIALPIVQSANRTASLKVLS